MNSKFDPKSINGKKFKKTNINTILITAVVLWIPAIIITVLTGNLFPIPAVYILLYLLSTFTNIFCVGKVYCILAGDRLYYFESLSTVGRRTETTCQNSKEYPLCHNNRLRRRDILAHSNQKTYA